MTAEASVVHRFARIARSHGGVEAIADSSVSMTYSDLDEWSTRWAAALLDRGVRPGDCVGLYFDRDPAALIALLGTLKSGAAAVPLLASHPHERLRQVVDDARPSVVLSDPDRAQIARALGVPVLSLDPRSPALLPSVPPPLPEADHPAMILYTSGSTGRPKGIMQTHGLLLQKYKRVNAVLQIRSGDRVTFFSSFAVGQGVNTIVLAFLSGATLCPFDIRREGVARLTDWMTGRRLTVYVSSATLLRNLMRTVGERQRFPDLRTIRVGGERVMPSDIVAARRVFPAARVIVNYACTEAGPISMHPIDPDESFPGGVVPIGRPLEGIIVRVLDEDGREVEKGGEGELAVESTDIAEGYWRDPERTAREFMSLPERNGRRLYRTGDLGRVRPDGLLEHLGRKDLRVKIRGFRVEIEEVETVLNQHPDVVRSAVAARPGPEDDLRLVAYVQLAVGSDATVETLRAQVGFRLPEYAIPSAFVFVDEIPLTESGKIARQRLPEPPPQRPVLAARCVVPRTPLEAHIAQIWREVLGLEEVGVHDAFFSIGGDSLKATLVASRIASKVGVALPLLTLLEASTVSELAEAIERQAAPGHRPT